MERLTTASKPFGWGSAIFGRLEQSWQVLARLAYHYLWLGALLMIGGVTLISKF
jgi:hypothetical protein